MSPSALPRGTLRLRGNKTHCFPRSQLIRVLPPNSKNRKPTGTQICRGFKEHGLITCESKVQVVFSLAGTSECCSFSEF